MRMIAGLSLCFVMSGLTFSALASERPAPPLERAAALVERLEAGQISDDGGLLSKRVTGLATTGPDASVCERRCATKFVDGYDQCDTLFRKLGQATDPADGTTVNSSCAKAALSGLNICRTTCNDQRVAKADVSRQPG